MRDLAGYTLDELAAFVIQWAKVRGILDHPNPKTQLLKMVEELGETTEAILKDKHSTEVIDGIGDMFVVLVILADMVDSDIYTCASHAINEIKNRKGRMVDGAFVRET